MGNRTLVQADNWAELAALRALIAEQGAMIAAQDARIAMLERRVASKEPRDEHVRLIGSAALAIDQAAFSTADLINIAEAAHGELRLALQMCGVGGSARRLGKLFCRLEGQVVGGLQVQRIGSDRDGIVWRILRV